VHSKAGNELASLGKMQIKGEPWQHPTGHLPLGPGVCHEVTTNLPGLMAHHEPRDIWEGANKRQK